MNEMKTAWEAVRYGGPMVYPLLALGVLALIIILDRAVAYTRALRLPRTLLHLIETYSFDWRELDQQLQNLPRVNAYRQFFSVIARNHKQPAWWVESRAGDEAGNVEKSLARGLWMLETIVTAAPLMGLLGTITGMMEAFKVMGVGSLVAPTQVTAGVAEALIATALGLLIALFALFAFNFFARLQSRALDQMERLGSRLIDHIRLDAEGSPASSSASSRLAAREAASR